MNERLTRAKAIRLKCLDCCGDSSKEVLKCASVNCPLWRYRRGKEERDELYCHSHQKKDGEDDV